MRILTVANVPPDPDSGAAGTVFHTNVALRALGHEVEALWAKDLGSRHIRHGNLHSLLEQPRGYRRAVLQAVGRQTFDAVMISQPQGYLAAQALRKLGFKGAVINRSHGLELRVDAVLPEWHRRLHVPESRVPWLTAAVKPLLRRQWTQAVKWFDAFVLPCEDDRQFLQQACGVPDCRAAVIAHGVPDTFLSTPLAESTGARRRRMLYVGQHAFIKGPDILIEVLNRLLPRHSDLSMTWVTSADAHDAIGQRLHKAVRPRVEFRHWVPQEALLPLYDSHGLFVFPSFFEGAGKACAEALARGLRVVATDTGGMKDHLLALGAAGRCPPGDVEAFVQALEVQLKTSDQQVRAEQSQQAAYMRAKSWGACAEQLVSLFKRMKDSRCDAKQ